MAATSGCEPDSRTARRFARISGSTRSKKPKWVGLSTLSATIGYSSTVSARSFVTGPAGGAGCWARLPQPVNPATGRASAMATTAHHLKEEGSTTHTSYQV